MTRALRGGLAALTLAALVVETAGCAKKKFYGESQTQIEVGAGDDIVLALDSNPTTGYSWVIGKQPEPAIAALLSSDYEGDGSGMPGAGGQQHFVFRAVGPGTTTIRLDYRRPWEQGAPTKSSTFAITVR